METKNLSELIQLWKADLLEFSNISKEKNISPELKDLYSALATQAKKHIREIQNLIHASNKTRVPGEGFVGDPFRTSIYDNKTLGHKNTCYYCGTTGITNKDHFWPKSIGGKLKVHSCLSCNKLKKNRTPNSWLTYLNHCLGNSSSNEDINKFSKMINTTQALWDEVKWSI